MSFNSHNLTRRLDRRSGCSTSVGESGSLAKQYGSWAKTSLRERLKRKTCFLSLILHCSGICFYGTNIGLCGRSVYNEGRRI